MKQSAILQCLEGLERKLAKLRKALTAQARPPGGQVVDKRDLGPHIDRVFQEIGVCAQPIGAEKVQQLLASYLKPEDNAFSRGIIEMRGE